MVLAEKMMFLFRLISVALCLATEVSTQQSTGSDFIAASCQRSLMQLNLPAQYVVKQYVRFSAIDENGAAYVITDALATKCGYTIAYDGWGNIVFRTSLYSCYTQIENDTNYTASVKIEISSRPDMGGAMSYFKVVSCPYVWSPREAICETNYMEVSVRRKIPVISEGVFRDEPEDWSTAFTQAVSGLMSVWQVVFHLSTTQKTTMMTDAAQNIGYGIKTTESRIMLRAPYDAAQALPQKIGNVTFSTVRATLFYKQRWFIFLVDNAVACPVDDVKFMGGWIVWTVPKNVSSLLTGAKYIQSSRIQFGIDLLTLTDVEIISRNYQITDSNTVTITRIPYGAVGGYYKSHVMNFNYGITYSIRPFLENVWVDDGWGVTKYTIIKDITTPFEQRTPVITNETIPSTQIFNCTVGPFLPDVRLVNVSVGGTMLTVSEGVKRGYTIENRTTPDGTVTFILKVPFSDQLVSKEVVPNGIRFVLNVTFVFKIIPYDEIFNTTGIIEHFQTQPFVGPCGQQGGVLTATLGNLDPSWRIYVKNTQATSGNLLLPINQTFSTVQVPAVSNYVMNEGCPGKFRTVLTDGSLYITYVVNLELFIIVHFPPPPPPIPAGTAFGVTILYHVLSQVTNQGLAITIPISITDQNGNTLYKMTIFCDPPSNIAVCLPNGTVNVVVTKISNIPDMVMSKLTLRDTNCFPRASDDSTAQFTFAVNSCKTTRRFTSNLMIYENQIFYVSTVTGKDIFIMNVTCTYATNGTLVAIYSPTENPPPNAQTGLAPLDLVMRLSKDDGYRVFYEDPEYPVVKYLRDPLYFEVELMYSSDPQLELFLDHCWATTTPDMGSLPAWPIIDSSCEYKEPYQTIFHPVTSDARVRFPSHLKRFEVKTFTFTQGDVIYTGQIYFHCDAIICDPSNLASDPACMQMGPCIPARQRIGRSVDAGGDEHRLISSGAVFLLASKMRANAEQFENPPQ
ncbi:uncharacterized protein LOC122935133 [Bufo gargarizans]|uniref:uncharacterized protein LOC122935133 n=1 Tax=Bufo gargarizans TaxID=30331 RepID=UPI001CF40AC9|nr:uncharacterized protein LOC122935133 [Bufo gargarizans]